MTDDETIIRLADASRDQYFLSSPQKLALLLSAAGIRPTDHVVEVGAGVGTVARSLPPNASLTLIELDDRFSALLRANVPHATVIQGDALTTIRNIPCDVLLSNLPASITESIIKMLPRLSMRTVVMALGAETSLDDLGDYFSFEEITTISGSDFKPPQPGQSRLVKLSRIVRER